jgi:methionyl-tRNA synthetase
MPKPFYVTTPIYYVNARPHLGHAYTTIIADVITRFHSMRPTEVYFLTGTDEHGDKVVRAAIKENLSPRAYVDQISHLFRTLWPELNISNNYFVRTTDASHMEIVSRILQNIYDAGDIYFSEYEGLYCFGCERFYTDRELVDGKCPDHETAPETIKESNYFFKMSRYQDWLLEHINKHPDFIRPERYRNEVLAFLREPLEDLCISRPKSRLKWGITLPFDENYVTYVWFDALLNYISALGYPDGELFQKFWPVAQHIVAKDILKPHGIYWPIMLKAAGIPIYQHLNVHGYWNIEQSKMSKSLGNVVEPLELKNLYGLDAFRFFLIREMKFGLDSSFSQSALVQRINSDLANDLGNLFSRIISMAHKYFKGCVPQVDPQAERELDLDLQSSALETTKNFEIFMESFEFQKAMTAVWEFIGQMNKTIDVTAPWVLAKKKSSHKQLAAVIYHLLEGLRIISGLIYPVMPDTAKKMQQHLGLDPDDSFYHLKQLRTWKLIAPGTTLLKSVALFPRIEIKESVSDSTAQQQEKPAVLEIKPEITLDEFSCIDLRVATVVHAEPIYTAEEMIGKQVIVVANLKPAKLMGVVSNGMLLAAVDDSGPTLATLEKTVAPGTPLK